MVIVLFKKTTFSITLEILFVTFYLLNIKVCIPDSFVI